MSAQSFTLSIVESSPQISGQTSQCSRLLSLPAELRNEIYDYTFQAEYSLNKLILASRPKNRAIASSNNWGALLRSCKTVLRECYYTFLQNSTYRLKLSNDSAALAQQVMSQIRYVKVDIDDPGNITFSASLTGIASGRRIHLCFEFPQDHHETIKSTSKDNDPQSSEFLIKLADCCSNFDLIVITFSGGCTSSCGDTCIHNDWRKILTSYTARQLTEQLGLPATEASEPLVLSDEVTDLPTCIIQNKESASKHAHSGY